MNVTHKIYQRFKNLRWEESGKKINEDYSLNYTYYFIDIYLYEVKSLSRVIRGGLHT